VYGSEQNKINYYNHCHDLNMVRINQKISGNSSMTLSSIGNFLKRRKIIGRQIYFRINFKDKLPKNYFHMMGNNLESWDLRDWILKGH
jgi:hypothetical protein